MQLEREWTYDQAANAHSFLDAMEHAQACAAEKARSDAARATRPTRGAR